MLNLIFLQTVVPTGIIQIHLLTVPPFYPLSVTGFEWARLALDPVDHGDGWLWPGPVLVQLDGPKNLNPN